jgi:hypothetical protein
LSTELGQELIGGLGPGERLAALVPAIAEPADRANERLEAGEVTAAQRLAVDDGEEHLDEVQPAHQGGREVQPDPGTGAARLSWSGGSACTRQSRPLEPGTARQLGPDSTLPGCQVDTPGSHGKQRWLLFSQPS